MAFRAVKILFEQGDIESLTDDFNAEMAERSTEVARYQTRKTVERKIPIFIKKIRKFMEMCKKMGLIIPNRGRTVFLRKSGN